jgi:hypothetical protein
MTAKTTAEWREIWLGKLDCLRAKGLKKHNIAGFSDFISRFLLHHTCHPGKIPSEAIVEFISKNSKSGKQAKFCRDALTFFYTYVVKSGDHVAVIKGVSDIKPPYGSQKQKTEEFISRLPLFLRRIRNELKVRNYSPRSIKNYGMLSCDYLTWLSKEPSADDLEDIKRYQLFLKENKDYAPKTVNLAAAAIIFMYNTVLGIPIEPTSLPRMKTGRHLPKVYSEADVE